MVRMKGPVRFARPREDGHVMEALLVSLGEIFIFCFNGQNMPPLMHGDEVDQAKSG